MPGRKKHRGPELPRTVSVNSGLHKTPGRLTHAEINLLERFIECARIAKTKTRRDKRWNPVPPKVWEPIAAAVAIAHGITVRQMLYHGTGYRFVIPRSRFWRVIRALSKDGTTPRFSLKAIAGISGHDHTSVLHALKGRIADMDYEAVMRKVTRYERAAATAKQRADAPASLPPSKRRDHTGMQYGTMTVLGPAEAPDGRPGRWWRCSCTCGSTSVQATHALVQGKGACGINGHRATPHTVIHKRPGANHQEISP